MRPSLGPLRELARTSPQVARLRRLQTFASASGQTCQRKVGFEFEDNDWSTWVAEPLPWFRWSRYWRNANDHQGLRPAHKHEVLSQGEGFTMEADFLSTVRSDLEFVTEAFPETEAGFDQLNRALAGIHNIYTELYRGAPYDPATGEFATASRVGLTNVNALLSGGVSGRPQIKMQATHGIPLAQVRDLVKRFAVIEGESKSDRNQHQASRDLLTGPNSPGNIFTRVLGETPAMAATVTRRLKKMGVLKGSSTSDLQQLQGFLILMINFVRGSSIKADKTSEGDAVKHRLIFMPRTDLATMFSMLPRQQKASLRGYLACFRSIVLETLNSPLGANEDRYDGASPLFRGIKAIDRSGLAPKAVIAAPELSFSTWFNRLLHGTDLARADHFREYLNTLQPILRLTDQQMSDRVDRVRGLGGLQGATDPHPVGGGSPMAILENRALIPGGTGIMIDFDRASDIALNTFEMMKGLLEGRDVAYQDHAWNWV